MKIDIISGFLGSGKTTIIKKLIESNLRNEKIVIIENEFGEISIDGAILNSYGIDIKEINSGCICCSLTKDFKESIKDIEKIFNPERIVIEPSGVAKLSDVIKSCREIKEVEINNLITVIDAINFESYLNNFGDFYLNQIKNAKTIIINDRVNNNTELLEKTSSKIKSINKNCSVITSSIEDIDGDYILSIAEQRLLDNKKNMISRAKVTGAIKKSVIMANNPHKDEFNSVSFETEKVFDEVSLKKVFEKKIKQGHYGNILRSKGMVKLNDDRWIEFHYTPGFFNIYSAEKQPSGKLVFIGNIINEEDLKLLFS